MKNQITFSKTTEKANLKCQKLKEWKSRVEKKLWIWQKLKRKKSFYVSQILKNKLKTNDFSYLIAKTRFHIRPQTQQILAVLQVVLKATST